MICDRNFDDLSHKFRRKIYASPKGIIRLAIVWEDLITALPDLTSKPLRVLDAGSGIGQISLALAKLGHELVLCDHSNAMLDLAKEQFRAEAPDAKVTFIHAPLQQLTREIAGQFDLVLCHAVLEWLATPRATLSDVVSFCKPNGHLSLLFYNLHGLIYLNLVKGNLRKVAAADFQGDSKSLTPTHPQNPYEVAQWLAALGFNPRIKSGVRVFHDLMRPETRAKRSMEDILALEQQFARQEPYCYLGRYFHMVCAREGTLND